MHAYVVNFWFVCLFFIFIFQTLVAKDVHFSFSTPSKFGNNGRGSSDLWGETDVEEGLETPDAPKQRRAAKSRIERSKLASISVALFTSPDDY